MAGTRPVTPLDLQVPQTLAAAHGVEIRHLRSPEEFAACVALQRATWGASFREAVPASILKITQRLGGITAGAFADDGTLLGFVFGITGIEAGEIVHWSDMLAVRDDVQSNGLGRQLKEFQRDALGAIGATRMYWTFDPLVARNAHFNLNRLGARVAEYVPDMYGADTGSVLHNGFGTDRFIVVWPLGAVTGTGLHAVEHTPHPVIPPPHAIPTLNALIERDDGDLTLLSSSRPPFLRIEIPSDIFQVNAVATGEARRWRDTTRRAFQWALANGYAVTGFERGEPDGVAGYLLAIP